MIGRTRRTAGLVVVGALAIAACSSSDDSGDLAIDDDPTTTVEETAGTATTDPESPAADATIETPAATGGGLVADVTVTAATFEELDRVRFDGIDTEADLSELELFMYAAGVDPVALTLYLDDEGLYTAIGMHPASPGDGGPIELQFVDGDDRGEPIELDLRGLPPAPGAWDTTVETVIAELGARAAANGTTLDELAATPPDELEPDLRIIKLVAGYVDDGTENDLESLVTATGEFDDDALALLDAMVAKIDPLVLVPGGITVGPTGFRSLPTVARPSTRPANAPARAVPAPAQGDDCLEFPLNIGSTAELAAAMETGVGATRTEGGAVDKLVQDVNALAQTTNDVPVVGQLAGLVQTIYATMDLWFNADAGRYPTFFTGIEVELSIDEFNEDFTEPGRVTSVSLTAASTGFDAANEFSQIASAAANAVAGKITGKAKDGVQLDEVGEATIKAGEKLRDSISGKIIKELSGRYLQWCPDSWTVDDAADGGFVEIEAVIGRITVSDPIGLGYEPAELGDDFLRVRADPDAFSGRSISLRAPVTTKELRVVGVPDVVTVKRAGDVAEITAELRNADTTTLLWEPARGQWNDGIGQETNEPGTRPLLTPGNSNAFPFLVRVESTSETGLRGESDEIRDTTIEVQLEDLIVEPDPGRVPVRKTLQFVATDSEGQPRAVTWDATGGSIGADGLYRAGNDPGTYTVTATAVDDPSVSVTVQVVVIEVECVVGTWRLRSQEFLDQIAAISGGFDISYRAGEYRLQVNEDGTYTGFRDGWTFGISTPEGTLVVSIDSTDPGTWSADETTVSVFDAGSEATVTIGIEVGGQVQTLPFPPPDTVGTEPFAGTGTYECDGNVWRTEIDDFTATFDRIG